MQFWDRAGRFVRLDDGVTHYELAGPDTARTEIRLECYIFAADASFEARSLAHLRHLPPADPDNDPAHARNCETHARGAPCELRPMNRHVCTECGRVPYSMLAPSTESRARAATP